MPKLRVSPVIVIGLIKTYIVQALLMIVAHNHESVFIVQATISTI
jgi:hypothetical protein